MLGLSIVAGTRRTWQKVCSRFAPCCVFFALLLSPECPGTTQRPRKLQEAAERHHHLRSLLSPAGGCCPRKAVPGSTQPSQGGSFTWVKTLQIWGGWRVPDRSSPTGSCAGGPAVFHCRSTERAPVLPRVCPHLCPWVKARSSFPSWI